MVGTFLGLAFAVFCWSYHADATPRYSATKGEITIIPECSHRYLRGTKPIRCRFAFVADSQLDVDWDSVEIEVLGLSIDDTRKSGPFLQNPDTRVMVVTYWMRALDTDPLNPSMILDLSIAYRDGHGVENRVSTFRQFEKEYN